MDKQEQAASITEALTVFFEEPFWVGVFERTTEGKLSVCRITFGAEPRDYEVQAFISAFWHINFNVI